MSSPVPPSSVVADRLLDYAKATSGVAVNQACLDQYQELKLKKQHKYVIYKLNPNMTEIIVDKSSKDTDYETFLGDLPGDEPRWAVYDFEYSKGDAGKRNKLVFYSWCAPPESKVLKTLSLRLPSYRVGTPTAPRLSRRWCTPHRGTPCERLWSASLLKFRART